MTAMLATLPDTDLRHRAHDLRNLFGAIASACHLLDDGPDEPRRSQIVDAIEEAAQRGGALTTDLLDPGDVRTTVFDLRERLVRLGPLLRTVAGADSRLMLDAGELSAPVRGAPDRFDHVVIELVANARNALAGPGIVRVRLRVRRGRAHLMVADSGCGMRPEDCTALLTRGPSWGPNGTGFQQVRRFAQDAHARLRLRSAPGKGTVVALDLPALLRMRH